MLVREAMTPHKECVGPNDTAAAAGQLMQASKSKAVPVLDHTSVAGTLEPAQVDRAVAESQKAPQQVHLREVLTSIVSDVAFENEDTSHVWKRMKNRKLSVIPVLNSEHKLVGMLRAPTGESP